MGDAAHGAVFLDDRLLLPDAEDQPRVRPEEAVPRPFLSPFHALQQEDVGAVGQFHQGRDGGFRIGEDLPADGDQVSLSGASGEGLKIWIVHGSFFLKV